MCFVHGTLSNHPIKQRVYACRDQHVRIRQWNICYVLSNPFASRIVPIHDTRNNLCRKVNAGVVTQDNNILCIELQMYLALLYRELDRLHISDSFLSIVA